jgi:hypothetical protein
VRGLNLSSRQGEPFVSRETLIQAYVSALPFAAVNIIATINGCRVSVGGELAPGEIAIATYFFRPLHIELLLGAAALTDDPVDRSPVAVASLISDAAKKVGAPCHTAKQLRAAAEHEVDKILERVRVSNQAGGLKLINRKYREYRQAQVAKAEEALPYSKFIEPYLMQILRQVAATGRMIA